VSSAHQSLLVCNMVACMLEYYHSERKLREDSLKKMCHNRAKLFQVKNRWIIRKVILQFSGIGFDTLEDDKVKYRL